MNNWKNEAARELAEILHLLLQGYFEDKQSFCDRLRHSTEALEVTSEAEALPKQRSRLKRLKTSSPITRLV